MFYYDDNKGCVYNLMQNDRIIPPPQAPKYVIEYNLTNNKLERVGSGLRAPSAKYNHRTMGYAKEPIPDPNNFLKAHSKQFTHQFPRPPIINQYNRRSSGCCNSDKNTYIVQNPIENTIMVKSPNRSDNYYVEKEGLRRMNDKEKKATLNGLQGALSIANNKLRLLSCITDTVPKRIKKDGIVKEIDSLEKEINLIHSSQIAYTSDY